MSQRHSHSYNGKNPNHRSASDILSGLLVRANEIMTVSLTFVVASTVLGQSEDALLIKHLIFNAVCGCVGLSYRLEDQYLA